MRRLLAGLDVGTTRTKAGLVDETGQELTRAAVPTPWRRTPAGVETDPEALAAAARSALVTALESAPAGEVLALGVTSIAETAVLLEAKGEVACPSVAWHDWRAAADLELMRKELGREVVGRTTGLGGEQVPTIATLRWLRANVAGARRAVHSLSVAEWVVHALGGELAAESSLASRTGAFAVSRCTWWAEALEWAGIPTGMFPPVRAAGEPFGRAPALGAGLERLSGAVLTVAGHDHPCAAVGTGTLREDQVLDSCGTAEAIVRAVAATPSHDPAAGHPDGVDTGRHVIPGCYALLGGHPLGLVLAPARREPGSAAAGAAAVAAVEEARRLLAGVTRLGGHVAEIRVTGGWSRDPLLRSLRSAAFPATVYPVVVEAGVRGAALLGGLAAGLWASVHELPVPPIEEDPG